MKVILELCTIGCLIWIGWNQSFRDHSQRIAPDAFPETQPETRTAARLAPARSVAVAPAPTPEPRDNSWLWERGKLDAPVRR